MNYHEPKFTRQAVLPVNRGVGPSSEVKLHHAPGKKTWAFKALLTMGRKTVEAASGFDYLSLEAADQAAEAFIRETLQVLVHGQADGPPGHRPETSRPIAPETRHGM